MSNDQTNKKWRLSDFGDSLFLIIMALVMFWFSIPSDAISTENTIEISSRLTSNPKTEIHEDEVYIEFQLIGYAGHFRFSSCTYNEEIKKKVNQLKINDQVIIYVQPPGSPHSLQNSRSKTDVVAASIPEVDLNLSFEDFNSCQSAKSNLLMPLLAFAGLLTAIFQIITKIFNKEHLFDAKYLAADSFETNALILHPQKSAYIARNTLPSITFLGLGLLALYFNAHLSSEIGWIIIGFGAYLFLKMIINHSKIYYIIDQDGIHIKSINTLFQPEIKTIKYADIEELITKQSLFEVDTDEGSIYIYTGETDDGNKIYDRLIGIKDYKNVLELIMKSVN